MKRLVTRAVMMGVYLLGACSKQPSSKITEITVYPAVVGEKTELYEVVASNALKLAPALNIEYSTRVVERTMAYRF